MTRELIVYNPEKFERAALSSIVATDFPISKLSATVREVVLVHYVIAFISPHLLRFTCRKDSSIHRASLVIEYSNSH